MSLEVWKTRVIIEYKKLKAFSDIELAKQRQIEWKNNCQKLEQELKRNARGRGKRLSKWRTSSSTDKEIKICYLNKCSTIPRGNKWFLINSNEKSSKDEENAFFNLPCLADDNDENKGFEQYNIFKTYNSNFYNKHQPLLEDNMLLELVQRLETKYDNVVKNGNTFNKRLMFKAIRFHFFKDLTQKALMDKYDKLAKVKNPLYSPLNQKHNNKTKSFLQLFCRRCFKYACSQHQNDEQQRTETNSSAKDRRLYNLKITEKPSEPCGNDCFLNLKTEAVGQYSSMSIPKTRKRRRCVKNEKFNSLDDLEIFKALSNIFNDNYCIIAKSMLNKSCKEVYELALKEKVNVENDDVKFAAYEPPPPVKIKKKVSRARKTRVLYSAHIKTNNIKKLCPYTPCNHAANSFGCNEESCSCIKTRNFCEKFCNCHTELCFNRFLGCQCKSQCNTKRCLCYSYGRECDPDLCKSCGACKFQSKETICKNTNIQRGIRKQQLLLAPSDIAGWGIFIKDGIKRNEYITEYCGEIITQAEANRRGKLYDKAKSSFLFDLDEEFVIDATRMGSKIRFANHSNKPNCYAKVIKVLGDHRIGIFAKRDILPGEEICFDYKYAPNECQKFLDKCI